MWKTLNSCKCLGVLVEIELGICLKCGLAEKTLMRFLDGIYREVEQEG